MRKEMFIVLFLLILLGFFYSPIKSTLEDIDSSIKITGMVLEGQCSDYSFNNCPRPECATITKPVQGCTGITNTEVCVSLDESCAELGKTGVCPAQFCISKAVKENTLGCEFLPQEKTECVPNFAEINKKCLLQNDLLAVKPGTGELKVPANFVYEEVPVKNWNFLVGIDNAGIRVTNIIDGEVREALLSSFEESSLSTENYKYYSFDYFRNSPVLSYELPLTREESSSTGKACIYSITDEIKNDIELIPGRTIKDLSQICPDLQKGRVLEDYEESCPSIALCNIEISPGSVSVYGYTFEKDDCGNVKVAPDNEGNPIQEQVPPNQTIEETINRPIVLQRVVVLLINFDSNPIEPVSKEEANKFYFDQNNPDSLSSYYKEVSYGSMNLVGDIYGYYTLSYSQISPYSGCGYSTDDVHNYIRAINDVNFDNYDGVILTIVPRAGCSAPLPSGNRKMINTASGGKEIGVVYNFIDVNRGYDKLNEWAMPHEFGHALGLYHSDYLYCQSSTITENIFRDCKFFNFRVYVGCSADDPTCSGCSVDDQDCINFYRNFGDSFDLMGSNSGGLSVYQREKLGFLFDSQINVVRSSGIYTIEPRQTNTLGVKAIKIPLREHSSDENDKDFYYYIEYIRPIGSDASLRFSFSEGQLDGAFVHLVNPDGLLYPTTSDDQAILDMSPHPDNDMPWKNTADVALKSGQTFNDEKHKISIKTIEVKDNELVVEVNFY